MKRIQRWEGPAAILLIAVLAAVAVLLFAREQTGLKAQREARAAAADAVTPVGDALRKALSDAASGTVAGAQQVALADTPAAGVSGAVATRARDSGVAVFEDSGKGLVVVATYDTPSPPSTVEERRQHATGLRIASLDLRPTLNALRPARGGISLAGPERTIQSIPGPRPSGQPTYAVKLQPGPVQEWTLTLWTAPRPIPPWAWLTALGIVVAGLGAAGWLVRRDNRSRRSQQELVRLQETSATTAALATVAQHSLDLADLLPAMTNELATALGLQGLSLGAPTPDGERLYFTWGVDPDSSVAAASVLPARVRAGDTLCLVLGRGGRTVARLRVVAGRDLDRHDLGALGAATEVLTSALTNAETFAQQRDLLERMRSVDELKTVFLATASHELRTPVGAITGYAQLLATNWDTLSSEEARMFAEQVDSNAQRLGALVEDLLDFARLERGAGVMGADSVLDLGEVVARILDEQPDLAPDHQVLHQTIQGLGVAGSWQAVERVVSNLVGNAAKYSPAGTVIRVTVKERRGRAELTVDDEGPGVPPAEREQVFTRFFRGRGDSVVATRGAGLGLAIVSEFAATMAGQVSVTSADGGGARFVVSYPLAGPPEISVEGAHDVRT
ncbi:MAG: HAMP domain-containing sensor histidine kinase [Marmoricola sp.]